MPDRSLPTFYDTARAAEVLHLSAATLKAWRSAGTGPRYVKLGRRVAYREVDLLAFVEAHLSETDDSGQAA